MRCSRKEGYGLWTQLLKIAYKSIDGMGWVSCNWLSVFDDECLCRICKPADRLHEMSLVFEVSTGSRDGKYVFVQSWR